MQNRAARISKYKIINFDDVTNENKTEHNPKWPYTPDHPYRLLIIGGVGWGKINATLNLINNELGTGRICLYAKDPYEAKYQYLLNKREIVDLRDYDLQDVCKNIEEQNLGKNAKKYD